MRLSNEDLHKLDDMLWETFGSRENYNAFQKTLDREHSKLQIVRYAEIAKKTKPPEHLLVGIERRTQDLLEKLAEEARVFVFHLNEGGLENLDETNTDPLDLPFPVCFFEANGQPLMNWHVKKLNQVRFVSGAMVQEIEPKKYRFVLLESIYKENQLSAEINPYEDSPILRGILRKFLQSLSKQRSDIGVEKVPDRFKTSSGVHKVKNIVHVVPKELRKSVEASHRGIDWQHRWEVRGHWRGLFLKGTEEIDFSRVGKNRDEEEVVPGYTWVKEHLKGPENAPVVKKLRSVGPENSSTDLIDIPQKQA